VSYDFFRLDEYQEEAVETAINEPLLILTGGPGTGKTTVCKNVIAQLKKEGYKDISLACPTGKAAKRLTEQVKRPASTIHRLLKYNPTLQRFEHGELFPLECQALILDEVSMVDIELFDHVLCACPKHPDFKLILVGDQDQLPSVGPGNILKDLIASKRIPTVHLQKIHRQSPDSWISRNAARVNAGKELHLGEADDFFWIERENAEKLEALGFPVQVLTPAEAAGRFPFFDYAGAEAAVFDPSAGWLDPPEALQALYETARGSGADGSRIRDWRNGFQSQPRLSGNMRVRYWLRVV